MSHAAEVVLPGDLAIVRGGTYFEHVRLTRPGTEGSPIIYRAEPGHTVVVTFGQWPEGFERTPQTRFTYQVTYAYAPLFVWEDRSVSLYMPAPDIDFLDGRPGSYFYDASSHTLFVHALGNAHPDAAVIVVVPYGGPTEPSATPGYEWSKGIWPYAPDDAPLYNHIEGFTINYQPIGIQLRMSHSHARRNTVYGCTAGITTYRGSHQVIEENTCFLNYGSGLHLGSVDETDILVQNNLLWDNGPNAPFRGLDTGGNGHSYSLAAYGGPRSFSVIGNRLFAFDPERQVFPSSLVRYKGIQPGSVVTRNNLLVGGGALIDWGGDAVVASNTVIDGNIRERSSNDLITPEWLNDHPELVGVVEKNIMLSSAELASYGFADPTTGDFRLQSDSSWVAAGEGAYPTPPPLRYVSPEGDDLRSGRAPAQAWRSVQKALDEAVPGETIYLMAGIYTGGLTLSVSGTEAEPIAIKSYARGQVVVIPGPQSIPGLSLVGCEHVEIKSLVLKDFAIGITVQQSRDIELSELVIDNAAQGLLLQSSGSVQIVNNTFTHGVAGIDVRLSSAPVTLRNNLFSDLSGTPLTTDLPSQSMLVSERNGFSHQTARQAWTDLVVEAHPSLVETSVAGLSAASNYALPVGSIFGFRGIAHRAIGARGSTKDTSPIEIESFRVEGALPDRAVLSWSTPADFAHGTVSGLPSGSVTVDQPPSLKSTTRSFLVTGLSPSTSYHLTLSLETPDGRHGSATLDLVTPATIQAPVTLYVSTTGDDAASGLSASEPLRTLTRALTVAAPGSTIELAPGTYNESVEVWWGGPDASHPLVIKSEVPGEATLDANEIQDAIITLDRVNNVVIEGLRFDGLWYSDVAYAIRSYRAANITLRNNRFEPNAWPAEHVTSIHAFFDYVDGLTVENNLFVDGFAGLRAWHSNDVTVDHNTFYRAGVFAVFLHGWGSPAYPENVWRVTNNIVVDAVSNHTSPGVWFDDMSSQTVCDYNLYVRTPYCPTMHLVGYNDDGSGSSRYAFTLDEVRTFFSLEAHGAFSADDAAVFTDPGGGDLSLKSDSPGLGMADDGDNVGYHAVP